MKRAKFLAASLLNEIIRIMLEIIAKIDFRLFNIHTVHTTTTTTQSYIQIIIWCIVYYAGFSSHCEMNKYSHSLSWLAMLWNFTISHERETTVLYCCEHYGKECHVYGMIEVQFKQLNINFLANICTHTHIIAHMHIWW